MLSSTCGASIALERGGGNGTIDRGYAGLDVHQATVVVCVLINERGKRPRKELRTFGTMTHELEVVLRDWLAAERVTQVGMESTGVYWRPVHAVLEEHFEVIVGNARHIRDVPGRKTDVKDAEWIADLCAVA
jgi:transposase